jgi:hypothetical protein
MMTVAIGTAVLKVLVGGLVVGLLHESPWLLTWLLLAVVGVKFFRMRHNEKFLSYRSRVITGMLISFVLGAFSEWLGTENGWWVYHLYENTAVKFPPWVPVAWAIAYRIFFELEENYFSKLTPKLRWVALGLTMIFLPPLGEITAMHLGTWYYTFQPQFLMMPLQAVVLIALVHALCSYLVKAFVRPAKQAACRAGNIHIEKPRLNSHIEALTHHP